MGLLKKKKKRRNYIRTHATLNCPVTRGRAGWCRALCTPIDGYGLCGRIAPHTLRGRTQTAIWSCLAKSNRGDET